MKNYPTPDNEKTMNLQHPYRSVVTFTIIALLGKRRPHIKKGHLSLHQLASLTVTKTMVKMSLIPRVLYYSNAVSFR
jgi:hypothetical protein